MSEGTVPVLPSIARTIRRVPPRAWLAVALAAYFAVSFSLSWLRALELQTTTWDIGLYQQALWSTAHGRPFFETADVETGGYRSLLEVHTVFVLYLLVPLYAAFPSQATLFAVQSAVVALAAVPLYLLARDRTGSAWLGLAAAVVFLAWTPTLSSNLYDFHPEAFLPLELFTTVLLWERRRYAAGFAVAGLGWATFELAPVLLAAVGVFFLWPSRETWARWGASLRRGRWGAVVAGDLRGALWNSRVRASLGLVVGSVAAYVVLLDLRTGPFLTWFGTTPLPVPPTGYVIGGTPAALGLAWGNVGVGFFAKVSYWLLLLALLGFVPLLAPRALGLSLPWFAFTLFSSNTNYVVLGFQYGFIAGATLLIAFAYALPTAMALGERWRTRLRSPDRPPSETERPARRSTRGRWIVAGLAALIVVNVALTPANPWMQDRGLGSAYRVSYGGGGGFAGVEALVGLIPPGATVVASDNLFPLVANDPNAYSFFWTQNNLLALPFSPSAPPAYVLIADNRTAAVPAWLSAELYNSTVYGVRGVDWESPAGTLLLFETGFAGSFTAFGAAPPGTVSEPGSALLNPEAGIPATFPGGPAGGAAANAPGVLGTYLQGPWISLGPGVYLVTVELVAIPVPGNPPVPANETVAWVGAAAFAQSAYFGVTYSYAPLAAAGGATETFSVDAPGPTIQFEVQEVALATDVEVVCGSVSVTAA